MFTSLRPTLRRRAVAIGTAAALVAVGAAVTTSGTAASAASNHFSAHVTSQYVTIRAKLGSKFVIGELDLGPEDAKLNSAGIHTLNRLPLPGGVYAGSRGDFATGTVAGFTIPSPTQHVQSTAPVTSGTADTNYLAGDLEPLFNAVAIHATTQAAYGSKVFGKGAKAQPVTSIAGDTADLKLLDISSLLGGLASILPKQLRKPLFELDTIRVKSSITTIKNSDGTHGLVAAGIGSFASVQILGGSANGGITLNLFSHDDGSKYDNAGSRVWATGKPGGAGCSYGNPDSVRVAVAGFKVPIDVNIGDRIHLPGNLGYIDAEFTGQSQCKAAKNGTSASGHGAGVGLHIHLQLPTGTALGDATISLPDMNEATANVPLGGIRG